MDERDGQLPWRLVVGGGVSLLVHAMLLLALAWPWPLAQAEPAADPPRRDETTPPARDRVELGQEESDRQTVAWVSHEAYQKLIAPKAETRQPAVQQKAEPAKRAPIELDPTPPVPKPAEPARRAAGKPPANDALGAARPVKGLPQRPTEAGEVTFRAEPVDEPGPADQRTAANPTRQGGNRGQRLTRAKRPQLPSDPTAAPKSDKESNAPTQLEPPKQQVRLGSVIAAEGIRIQTKVPDFSAVARVSSLPTNPRVRVTFDASGEVTNAKLLRSSGFENVDSPILTSLYQWKATGPRIQARDQPFDVTINVMLIDE